MPNSGEVSPDGKSVTVGWITPGAVSTGHWCDDCMLPSAIEITMSMLTPTSVTRLGTVLVCQECNKQTLTKEFL